MGSSSKKPAARLGDIGSNHGPWPPTPIIAGSGNVFVNGIPAARKGDAVLLHAIPKNPPHPRSISEGAGTVLINGIPAARVSDAIGCGGRVATGSGNVLIGDKPEKTRNAKLELEFEELINKRISDPKVRQYTPHQKAQLEADIAVKYRGEQGAVDTWHDYYMSNDPTVAPASPAEVRGLHNAQSEKARENTESLKTASQKASNDKLLDTVEPLTESMRRELKEHPSGELPTRKIEALTQKILEANPASDASWNESFQASGHAATDNDDVSSRNGVDKSAQVHAKRVAAAAGVPFCEECAKKPRTAKNGPITQPNEVASGGTQKSRTPYEAATGEAASNNYQVASQDTIDQVAQIHAKRVAAAAGVPFCEECAKSMAAKNGPPKKPGEGTRATTHEVGKQSDKTSAHKTGLWGAATNLIGSLLGMDKNWGIAREKSLQEFVKEIAEIFDSWENMSTDERIEALERVVNRQLEKSNVPDVMVVPASDMNDLQAGQFTAAQWELGINKKLLSKKEPLTEKEMVDLAEAIFHEARHAEQWAEMGAIASKKGHDLTKDKNISPTVTEDIAARESKASDKVKEEIDQMYESVFGSNKAHRDQVLQDMQDAGKAVKEAQEKYDKLKKQVKNNDALRSEKSSEIIKASQDLQDAKDKFDECYPVYAALPEEADAHALGARVREAMLKHLSEHRTA